MNTANTPVRSANLSERERFLDLIFDEGDCINACMTFSESTDKWIFNREDLKEDTKDYQFFAINSLTNGTRKDQNVAKLRSFINESDIIPLDEQLSFYDKIHLPYTAAVYSGSKSIHVIITLDTPLLDMSTYSGYAKRIQNVLEALAIKQFGKPSGGKKYIDPANKNPSRLSRLAGAIRKDNLSPQKLEKTNNRISLGALNQWLTIKESEINGAAIQGSGFASGIEFPAPLPSGLFYNTRKFISNGAPVGQWNNELYKAARNAQGRGCDKGDFIDLLSRIDNQYGNWSGQLDHNDLTTIESAYNKPPSYLNSTFPVLNRFNEPAKSHPDNFNHLVVNHLDLDFRYNQLKGKPYFKAKSEGGERLRPIQEKDLSYLRNSARRAGLSSDSNFIIDGLTELAVKNEYHPFKSAVEATPWDGKDHIAELFDTFTISKSKASNTETYKTLLRKWLIGLVAKVYNPGSQNMVLILLSDTQGTGKSKWFSKLGFAPEIFAEGAIDPQNKDHVLNHLNYVIWHISELDGTTSKREASQLKDYFTKEYINARPAYDRTDRTGKSTLSFCGSLNERRFLNDATGNRRYWVIDVEKINYEHSVNIQQVFAQALDAFRNNEKYWLDDSEIQQVNNLNSDYEAEDLVNTVASKVELDRNGEMTGVEIFSHSDINSPKKADLSRLGTLLNKAGIPSKRVNRGGTKITVYSAKLRT